LTQTIFALFAGRCCWFAAGLEAGAVPLGVLAGDAGGVEADEVTGAPCDFGAAGSAAVLLLGAFAPDWL